MPSRPAVFKGNLYKIIGPDARSFSGGNYTWDLPKGNKPGAWTHKVQGELRVCRNGYHLTDAGHVAGWTSEVVDSYIYLAEGRGEFNYDAEEPNKIAFRQARLTKFVGVLKADGLYSLTDLISAEEEPIQTHSDIVAACKNTAKFIRDYKKRITAEKKSFVAELKKITKSPAYKKIANSRSVIDHPMWNAVLLMNPSLRDKFTRLDNLDNGYCTRNDLHDILNGE